MTLIRGLQREIEALYGVSTVPQIEDFLITTDQLRELAPSDDGLPKVLLAQDGEGVRLSIHLGDEVQRRVESTQAPELEDFCIVAEEISHFIYLCFRAQIDAPVSKLDLEVQAEIDKFILATRFFPAEGSLFERLFEDFRIREGIAQDERERYREANRLAARFSRMISRDLDPDPSEALAGFLAGLYRMDSPRRLCKIESLGMSRSVPHR